jgi:hypothetical protein
LCLFVLVLMCVSLSLSPSFMIFLYIWEEFCFNGLGMVPFFLDLDEGLKLRWVWHEFVFYYVFLLSKRKCFSILPSFWSLVDITHRKISFRPGLFFIPWVSLFTPKK